MAPRAELSTGLFRAALAAALLCGLGSQALLALDPQGFAGHWFRQPAVLLAVHLSTLGFLTLLILGVLTQFMPMLLGKALASTFWAAACLALFGLSALLLFVYFGTWRSSAVAWTAAGGLWISLTGFAALSAGPFFAGGVTHRLSRATLASALGYLLFTAGLGGLMAQGLLGPSPLASDPLQLLTLHLHLGLFGFGALMVFGVSYELLPMFNLGKGYPTWPGWAALAFAHVGLLCLTAQTFGLCTEPTWAHGAWALSLALSAALYVAQVLWIGQRALRRQQDSSIWSMRAAWAWLLVTAAWGLRLVYASTADPGQALSPAGSESAYIYLGLFGFLGGAIFSQLQKIVPLLSWYDRFAPLAGKAVVPTSAQLLDARLAWASLVLHSAAVAVAAAGLALAAPGLIRLAGLLGAATFLNAGAMVLVCRYGGSARPLPAPMAAAKAAGAGAGAPAVNADGSDASAAPASNGDTVSMKAVSTTSASLNA